MSGPLDPDEGPLADPKVQREQQQMAKKARQIIRDDLTELNESAAFRRWLGKYMVPLVLDSFRTNNGSELQHFHGQRDLALKMMNEFEDFDLGFLERVLETRRLYEQALRQEPQKDK